MEGNVPCVEPAEMDEQRGRKAPLPKCNNTIFDVYSCVGIFRSVELINIYQCFCDRTRLRILNLLGSSSLCVCHFQELLGEPQVKISKHLGYLKTHGLVTPARSANWMVYSLPETQTLELRKNLACLQDCAKEDPIFRKDGEKLQKLRGKFKDSSPICCPPKSKVPKKASMS